MPLAISLAHICGLIVDTWSPSLSNLFSVQRASAAALLPGRISPVASAASTSKSWTWIHSLAPASRAASQAVITPSSAGATVTTSAGRRSRRRQTACSAGSNAEAAKLARWTIRLNPPGCAGT